MKRRSFGRPGAELDWATFSCVEWNQGEGEGETSMHGKCVWCVFVRMWMSECGCVWVH